MWNILLLCSGHHQQLHDGRLTITGRAPDELIFEWARDVDEGVDVETPSGDVADIADRVDLAGEVPFSGFAGQTSECLVIPSPSWDCEQRGELVTDGAMPA